MLLYFWQVYFFWIPVNLSLHKKCSPDQPLNLDTYGYVGYMFHFSMNYLDILITWS